MSHAANASAAKLNSHNSVDLSPGWNDETVWLGLAFPFTQRLLHAAFEIDIVRSVAHPRSNLVQEKRIFHVNN